MNKLLSDKIVEALELGKRRYGSVAALARASKASEVNIGRWIKRQQKPKVSEVEELLELIGAKLMLPDETLVNYDLIPKVAAPPFPCPPPPRAGFFLLFGNGGRQRF